MKMQMRRQAIVLVLFSLALLFPSAGLGATPQVAAGRYHIVGLQRDGTVIAVCECDGGNYCNVSDWTDIIQVAAGYELTVGLRSDGTVVAVGYNFHGRCEVSGWTDIVQVAVGHLHTVGLRSDGTVVAVGHNQQGECEVSGWTDIAQVAAGDSYTVGLRSDGTVVTVGSNFDGQCEVSGWTDIVQVVAGDNHTVGLRSDGTVVAVGYNIYDECEVIGWTDIVQVAAGWNHTVGLRRNGTVVAVGDNRFGRCEVSGWTDIVQVAAGDNYTVGLRHDGTVVAVGACACNRKVSGWNLDTYTAPACGPDNLDSCVSEADCTAAGGWWYDNQCHAEQEVIPVNGACGAAHGVCFSEKPTSGLCATGTASYVSGSGPWFWECYGSNGGDDVSCHADVVASTNSNYQAHPLTPQVPVLFPDPVDPSGIQVVVGACPDVIIHPSLKVPVADVGKSATMIMYIYLPDMGFGINVPAHGTTILAAETVIDLLPTSLDFSGVEGYEFYVYYGYVLDSEIKYNAYSITVDSICTEVPNCAEITDEATCNAIRGCVFHKFPDSKCVLDCESLTTEETCNNAFDGNSCKWVSTPFGDVCTVK
jgi:alpha-tubulin suppressor-like RCC1 family protein